MENKLSISVPKNSRANCQKKGGCDLFVRVGVRFIVRVRVGISVRIKIRGRVGTILLLGLGLGLGLGIW
jgi:hypothetical protein